MKAFVELSDKNLVQHISTFAVSGTVDIEVEITDKVDFNRLNGYRVSFDEVTGGNVLKFDELAYNDWLKDEAKKKANEMAQETLEKLKKQMALNIATDDEALLMQTYYPGWAADTMYTKGEIVAYGDDLFRVAEGHKSDKDAVPGVSKLYTKIVATK